MPRNTLLLLGRLLIAALFLPSGLETLSNLDGAASYFAGLGLPLPTLAAWGAGLFETAAGVLILIGWQTPIAALLLALFAAFAGFVGHFGQGGEDATLRLMHSQAFWKDIAIAGGLFILAASGAGAYSLDSRLR